MNGCDRRQTEDGLHSLLASLLVFCFLAPTARETKHLHLPPGPEYLSLGGSQSQLILSSPFRLHQTPLTTAGKLRSNQLISISVGSLGFRLVATRSVHLQTTTRRFMTLKPVLEKTENNKTRCVHISTNTGFRH